MHVLLKQLWTHAPGVTERDRILFATAVAEVAGNIIKHGRTGQQGDMTLVLRVDAERLEAMFVDSGGPVDGIDDVAPPAEMSESGRGLGLVRVAVDELTYRRTDDRNEWRLVRRRRRPADG